MLFPPGPRGKLYAAYSAALSGRASELFNPAEQLIYIAGILSYKTAFKCQHIIAGPAVPDFSIAHQSLVCINLYQVQCMGAPTISATLMSVIFKSPGLELVFT